MNEIPFFSIIVPAFNRALLLPALFHSVISQNFPNWECIVVDDGSTDNTKQVVESFVKSDSRFKYVFQENAERSVARNKGAQKAKGLYLLFLDSDDYYLPGFLTSVYQCLVFKKEPVGMLITGYHILREGESEKPELVVESEWDGNSTRFFYKIPVIPARMVIHASIFKTHFFDENIVVVEDQVLCFYIAADFPVWYFPELNGVVYRIHEQNSVNPNKNPFVLRLAGLRRFFSDNKYKRAAAKIPRRERKKLLAHCMYKIGVHHSQLNSLLNAIVWFFRAQIACPGYKWKEMIYSILVFRLKG